MRINDENVVIHLRGKNEKALHYVIDRYGGLVKAIVKKHLYNLEQVQEECIDDVFLAVWNNIDQFSGEKTSLKNWIAVIAKYKTIDYKRKYLKLLQEENIEAMALKSPLNADGCLMEKELSYEVDVLLNNLKEEDKELFISYYIDDKEIEDIAKETGVKKSSIYNRLSRGRKKLKDINLGSEIE
ncbi:RNA polymerase sigma factor, sigma-70 family protein [Clostridium argentinense CDC 2741]|uniref:RNA polymerase sigma factor, sigma-70 family protein n=1 Tax=Clostridium argentinense CDC 2741 TaxID=1418104 RepID=A0A0C1U9M6_9CLOT|nr:sigma-70 family RNA polymerase sigma factor [Clostridium argentinense]ARC86284.1 RNA polymerase subunit sigma-70 [Clostridium argentinense]KIE44305.1 RNA polymerase sigma factor, sigma-70 family protein [Clostridium argentinense CDC 2741]NFF40656.1 sigma-70 family RNA polymerase sigma factor [Clostridium argentinense]NFP51106.1 sigma-70 family RNA polymerase sigma factor [Clostridium argentinense]NFP73296.1 sigma-70 family RNA polymerase sigma factor [Clostridium argentinense]